MRIFTLLISAALCMCFINPGLGQQVYQSGHYGDPGTQQLYSRHLTGFTNDEIIVSGPDISWDISALTASDLILSEIVTRDEAIDAFTFTALCSFGGINIFTCLNIWSNTQQAWLIQDTQTLIQFPITDLQRFQRKTSTQLLETFLGFTVDFGGSLTPVAIVYQNPDTVLTFPMTYGDSLSSQIAWGIDLSATGQNIQYSSHQFRTSKVDAWGTLITPYDTLEGVLRVRAVIERNDTLISDSLAVPISLSQVEYSWFDISYGIPVMIATGFVTDSTELINTVTYLVESFCGEPEWTVDTDTSIYYITESGNAVVEFSLDTGNADVFNWDFADGTLETSTGNISHTYLSPGLYTVTVTGCVTNCLPLNTCTQQLLTIEIIDSTSAVHLLKPNDYGIKVYPNPAHANLTIDVPSTLGTLDFQLLDMHGASILAGTTSTGLNHVDISHVPPGLYLMKMQDPETGMQYRAERLLVMH